MDNNNSINSKIGMRINTLLAKNDVRQKDLAKVINVKDNIISYYCKGTRKPNIDQLLLIADYFGTSVDYLLGRTDIESTDPHIQTMCSYTGLSDEAWLFIERCNNDESGQFIKILSLILESETFENIVLSYKNIEELWLNTADYSTETDCERQKALNEFENAHRSELNSFRGIIDLDNNPERIKGQCKLIQFDIYEMMSKLQRELIEKITGTSYF